MPAALLLVAAALALLLSGDGGVVQAQERWLVSNIGQAMHSTSDLANEDLAQEFTTGTNDAGYTLSYIELVLIVRSVGNLPAVKLFHTSATGTEVATLTAPTSVTPGLNLIKYTPPAHTRLAKETSYWIVVEGGRAATARNTSTAEDPLPPAGWSIADQTERRAQSSTGAFTVYANLALQIGVRGTIIPNSPASGAPLIVPPTVSHVPTTLGANLSGISDPDGTWTIPNSATYKWQRFDATGSTLENDSIGTAPTYTLTDADVGKRLKVVVNFTDGANNSEGPLTSAATPVITPNAAPTSSNYRVTIVEETTGVFGASNFPYSDTDGDVRASVKITTLPAAGKGVLKVGNTVITDTELPLTLTYGELAKRWLSYTPRHNAFGSPYTTFKFKVNDGTADSILDYTMRINVTSVDDPGRVLISGQSLFRELGATLTASVSDPDGNVTNASWQWMRGDTARGTYSNISGATAATYDMVEADVGKFLKAMVSYTDGDGSGKSATSNYVRARAIIGTRITTVSRTFTAFNVNENTATSVVIKTYESTNRERVTWKLEGDDRADFTITINAFGHGELRFAKVPNYEMPADAGADNIYDVTVKVTHSDGSTDTLMVRVTVDDVNEAPTITGRHRQSVPENSTAVITLSATDEDASDTLTWSVEIWEDGGKFTIDPSSGALSFTSAPDFETPTDIGDTAMNNTYVVTVKVSDARGLVDRHPIRVTVTKINEAPEITTVSRTYTAFNRPENTSTLRTINLYRATGVGEGSVLTWSLEGADHADFTITKDALGHGHLRFANVPNYEMPADAGANNVYDVTVKVTDSQGGLSDTLTVRVTVDDVNEAPVIRAPPATRSIPENSTAVVTFFSATDVDASDTRTWSVESADDGGKFTINPSSGVLRFTNAPDFETPTDIGDTAMNNTYVVTVKVTDAGGLSDTHTITVTVTATNEAPEITTVSRTYTAFNRPENTSTLRTINLYRATGVGEGSVLTWSLEGADHADFTITKDALGHGHLRFANVPNYEMPADAGANNVYDVTVKVTDSQGGLSDTLTVRVTVDDVNEAPVIRAPPATRSVPENSTAVITLSATDVDASDTLTWSVESADDGGKFTINPSSGALRFTNAPDFETPTDIGDTAMNNTYVVTVKVTDAGGLSDTHTITVTVTATNEAPEITTVSRTYTAFNRPENIATSRTIKAYRATGVGEGSVLTWSLEGADRADFTITKSAWGHGHLRFANVPNYEMPADAGANNVYDVTVKVTDSQGGLSDTLTVRVTVDDVNEAPVIRAPPATRSIPENSTAVVTFSATDVDASDTLTWSVESADDGGKFTINPSSGALRFTSAPDFETPTDIGDTAMNNTYVVTVKVSDARGLVDRHPIRVTVTATNEAPEITTVSATHTAFNVNENTSTSRTINLYRATGVGEGSVLTWSLEGADRADFTITKSAWGHGHLRFANVPNYEMPADAGANNVYDVTVKVTDSQGGLSDTLTVRVTVYDVNEAPVFTGNPALSVAVDEHDVNDQYVVMDLADYDARDEEGGVAWSLTGTDSGDFAISADGVVTFRAGPNFEAPADSGRDNVYNVTVVARDILSSSPRRTVSADVTVTVADVEEDGKIEVVNLNLDPVVGETVSFMLSDPDGGISSIEWKVQLRDPNPNNPDAGWASEPSDGTNTTTFRYLVDEDHAGKEMRAYVAYSDRRGSGKTATSQGGGGPTPSALDFEWTVTRDIDELGSGHDTPSGQWSDGATLWVLENGDGADDAVYAYDVKTGERVEGREFELDGANRAPRGVWSDGSTAWVSDSGRERLFAHDLESGERLPERDIALAGRNRDARGIWSDDGMMWVLDGGKDSLFAYDLASGDLLAEYELASANGDPQGVWSDGVTFWVSDHVEKRLFAYRLPARPEAPAGEDAEPQALERVSDEEFPSTVLSRASNNSPRGLWSDGDVMYVADESDARVYTYNMPDAIDARLSSLSLSGVDIGEFAPNREEYEGVVDDGVTVTTVEAAAAQDDAVVVITPADADEAAEGRQVAVRGGAEITVTVTSADGSREQTYSVRIEETGPSASCLRGTVAEGFSLVVSEGGSIDDLATCAEGRDVTALYTLDGGEYVSYILGAPALVNEGFVGLFADGVPALTPLVARSDGPATADPVPDAVTRPLATCLQGEIVEGFNLVLYEGGSVGDLEACAEGAGLASLYVLDDGVWVSHILGAPAFVNVAFRDLYADGVPSATPLVGKRN